MARITEQNIQSYLGGDRSSNLNVTAVGA